MFRWLRRLFGYSDNRTPAATDRIANAKLKEREAHRRASQGRDNWTPPRPLPVRPPVALAPGVSVGRPDTTRPPSEPFTGRVTPLLRMPRDALAPVPGTASTTHMNEALDGSVFAVATDFDSEGRILRKVYLRSDVVRAMVRPTGDDDDAA